MAIAKDPERLRDVFKIKQLNSAGVYALDMWLLGQPLTVVLDDHLPLDAASYEPMFANIGEDGALWGPIFEKAAAKYLGTYEAVNAGGGAHGIEVMTGAPSSTLMH